MMKKHSITLHGHRTSFTLEDEFWNELKTIALENQESLASLIQKIDEKRGLKYNLSSALRIHILRWHMKKKS